MPSRPFAPGFRLSRRDAIVLVAGAAATIALEFPGWAATFSIALAATVVVVTLQLRKPSYHGVGWHRINPGLPEWWSAQEAER